MRCAGNEKTVSNVVNKLFEKGAEVIYSDIADIHVSGHACQEELKLIHSLIKPKYFMPVHGEYKMLKIHADSAIETGIPKENCFICSNGDALILRNGEVFRSNTRIQTDAIYVDGNDISGLSTSVIKDRKILADNGMVAVVICIDSRINKILCKPSIVSRGFVFIKESQTLMKEAENLVYDALKENMKQRVTFGDLKNCIRNTLEPFLFQKTNRNPIVIPVILNHKDAMIRAKRKPIQ